MRFLQPITVFTVAFTLHCSSSSSPTPEDQARICEQTSASACEDAGCHLVQWTAVTDGEACQREAAPTAICVFFSTTNEYVMDAVSVVVEDTDTNPRVFSSGNAYNPPPVGWRNCEAEGDDVAGCNCDHWTEVAQRDERERQEVE